MAGSTEGKCFLQDHEALGVQWGPGALVSWPSHPHTPQSSKAIRTLRRDRAPGRAGRRRACRWENGAEGAQQALRAAPTDGQQETRAYNQREVNSADHWPELGSAPLPGEPLMKPRPSRPGETGCATQRSLRSAPASHLRRVLAGERVLFEQNEDHSAFSGKWLCGNVPPPRLPFLWMNRE